MTLHNADLALIVGILGCIASFSVFVFRIGRWSQKIDRTDQHVNDLRNTFASYVRSDMCTARMEPIESKLERMESTIRDINDALGVLVGRQTRRGP